jgi:hypothetical protein
LQTLSRQVRANPSDRSAARAFRRAALRLNGPEGVRLVAELEGGLARTHAWGESAFEPKVPELPILSRVALAGRRPVLLPRLPAGETLTEAWRAPGVALWASDGVVLLERPDRALEARCPRSGEVLWSVSSLRAELALRVEVDEEERAQALGWAVAPWGAVELLARYEAPLEYRRVGQWHGELGRVTHRAPVGRHAAEVRLALQVVVPDEGSWLSRGRPEVLVERAGTGEPLCDTDLRLAEWDEDLLELSLDTTSRAFAVSWRDKAQDWTVFVVGGGHTDPSWLAPANWSPGDEDPFPRESNADEVLRCDGAILALEDDRLLRTDEGTDPRPWPANWPDVTVRLDGRTPSTRGTNPDLCARIFVAAGRLFVQRGDESLIAFAGEDL